MRLTPFVPIIIYEHLFFNRNLCQKITVPRKGR